ncbi:hypothetical protein [Bacillus sp. B15-48]|uniref:hypothetical protein n=1 Tax=Bacillus sp. B15-48 TaxID=1548601 RepID=UPI00193FA08F|nr:hypothetical protein [Bacillus sp. B15-48]MBM4760917.1 hypothetical protein [Bacillus sp. B15-48]
MLLELTLYLLIGFLGLLAFKAQSPRVFISDLRFVLCWPYYFLLKYVESIDDAKRNSRR